VIYEAFVLIQNNRMLIAPGNNLAKHVMLQRSIKFRELLLDWLTELISGIRLTDIHRNRYVSGLTKPICIISKSLVHTGNGYSRMLLISP
jgi:hypothetical protein